MTALLGTSALIQVAIVVKDIEVTKRKWAEFFGIEPPPTMGSGSYEVTKATYMGKPAPDIGCKMAFFYVGPNVSLELIEPNGVKSTWQDFLDENGEGIHHIAFGVKNTDEKIASCEKAGMTLVQRGKYGDGSGEYAYLDATASLKCIVETLESF